MRKIIVFNRMSVDGFFASTEGDFNWFVQDPALDAATHELMSPDTVLFGRKTYEQFVAVWPGMVDNPHVPEEAQRTARELNAMNKIVFSTTLTTADWVNSRLISGDLEAEVKTLKNANGGDITIFGSGSIVHQIARAGLVDEYLIGLTPAILGAGSPLFEAVSGKLELKDARTFPSGNVLLHYAPA